MYYLEYTSSSGPYADGDRSYTLASLKIKGKTPIRTAEIGFGWELDKFRTPPGFFKLINPIIAYGGLYAPTISDTAISSARLTLTNLDNSYQETAGNNNPSTRAILIHGTGGSRAQEQLDDGSTGCIHLLAEEITGLATHILENNQEEYYIFISGQEDFSDLPIHDKEILCRFYNYNYCIANNPTQGSQTLATLTFPGSGMYVMGVPTSGRKEQAIDIALPIIKHFERFDENDDDPTDGICHGYPCPAYKPTIGYGHLIVEGENWDNGVTEPEAAILLKNELMNHYYPNTISELESRGVDTDLLEIHQIAAAVVFQYNLGDSVISGSDSTWPGKLQPYDPISAEISWKAYHKAPTVEEDSNILCPLAGLMRRRFVEWQLFSTGNWEEYPEGWQEAYDLAKRDRRSQCTD